MCRKFGVKEQKKRLSEFLTGRN